MKLLNNYYPLMAEAGEEGSGGSGLSEEQIAAAFTNPTESQEIVDAIKDQQQQQQPPAYTPSGMWDYFKSDEGFKMPEGLTKDNESQLLEAQLKAKYGQVEKPSLHPLAKQIQEMSEKNPNISINDLIKTTQSEFVDISGFTVDQKIQYHLENYYGKYDAEKNPDGVTEEDVKAHIDKLGKIDKLELAKQIDENVKKYNEQHINSYEEQRKADFEKNYDTMLTQNNKHVDGLKTKLADVDSIFGIKVGPEERDAFIEEFRSFITPDKESMQSPLEKMLSDDMVLFKTFVIAAKFGEDKVIEAITKGRESTKEELFKKLKLTPAFSGQREERRTDDPDAIAHAFSRA